MITDDDVLAFARLTGDTNPVHLDDEYAAQTRFGRRIVHGAFGAGLISAVLGTQLPGPGAIYLHQTLDFLAPVFIGDTITATVEVIAIRSDKPILTCRTTCTNDRGERVLDGEAILLFKRAF
jgi:3-hydroxybutyryl-CoA dehydratase